MKKILLFTVLMAFTLTACQNEDLTQEAQKEKQIFMSSHLEDSIFYNVNTKLAARLGTTHKHGNTKKYQSQQVNNADLTEKEAKEILSPLMESGQEMRDELVNLSETNLLELSQEEVDALNNMDEATLAEFAYFMHVVTQEEYVNVEDMGNDAMQIKYTKADLLDCLTFSLGLNAISSMTDYIYFTKELMTATVAWQIGRALILRTVGWVGVAYTIYQYGSCLNSKRH
ncbi:MAG: hypothetical protein J6C31_07715 [Prevotella sp.]|nr:hypothetical protein [Prevotella sp.]